MISLTFGRRPKARTVHTPAAVRAAHPSMPQSHRDLLAVEPSEIHDAIVRYLEALPNEEPAQ